MNNRLGIDKHNFVIIVQNGSGLYGHRHVVKRTLNMRIHYLGSFASYFLFVWVGTNKFMGRLLETLVNQSHYTGVNGLISFP